MTSSIALRIASIRQQLPTSVRLIAVTKQVSVAAMRSAYNAGIRDFGESRIQEATRAFCSCLMAGVSMRIGQMFDERISHPYIQSCIVGTKVCWLCKVNVLK